MRKLKKWEIEALEAALRLPETIRWGRCPFVSYAIKQLRLELCMDKRKKHCKSICGTLFPRTAKRLVCPHACGHPDRYTARQITLKVRKLLREQEG